MALYPETKQLQTELNQKFEGSDPVSDLFKNLKSYQTTRNVPVPTNTLEESTFFAPEKQGDYSRFFGVNYDPTQNLENAAAHRQSNFERLAYMFPRISERAVSELVQIPGYVIGAAAWAFDGFDINKIGDLVDNAYLRGVQNIEAKAKNLFPVYIPDEIKTGGLFKNLLSPSFWATEGADFVGTQLAYVGLAYVPELLGVGKALGGLAKPGTQYIRDLEVGKGLTSLKTAGRINTIAGSLLNDLFMSTSIAGSTYKMIMAKWNDTQKAGEAAVDVLTKNFALMALPNYLKTKWLFGSAKKISQSIERESEALATNSLFKRILGPDGAPLDAIAARTTLNKLGIAGKTVAQGFVAQGLLQMGGMYAIQKRAEEGIDTDQKFLDQLSEIANIYVDSFDETDFWKQTMLGGIGGTLMAGWGARKNVKAEEKAITNFHELIKNNNINLYRKYEDFAKTEVIDGKVVPIRDPKTGKIVIDNTKVPEGLREQLKDKIFMVELLELAKEGNLEAFGVLHDKMAQDILLPFVQIDGGYEAGVKYIDNLSETEAKFMKEGDVDIDATKVKKDLTDKLTRYKKVYDKLIDTHDINMKVKYDKEDKPIYVQFSNYVFNNKFEQENGIEFMADRVNDIRSELANFKAANTTLTPITSEETKYSPKIVEELKTSLSKNRSDLTPGDIDIIESKIRDIEGHLYFMGKSHEYLKSLYNNKELQTSYEAFKKYKTDLSANSQDAASNTQKTTDASTLPQNLKDLYSKTINYEQLPNQEPVKDSGEIQVEFTDETGNKHKMTVRPTDPTEKGSLGVEAVKDEITDKDNKITSSEITDRVTHFLNPDGTIEYDGKIYKLDKEPIVVKTGVEARIDRAKDELMTSMNAALDHYKAGLSDTEDRIVRGKAYVVDLTKRLNTLLDKEVKSIRELGHPLTRAGTERKQSVILLRERGKNTRQLFLTVKELGDEIETSTTYLNQLETHRNNLLGSIKELESQEDALKSGFGKLDPKPLLSLLNKNIKDLSGKVLALGDLINSSNESISKLDSYRTKLFTVLKGFHTSAAQLLGPAVVNDIQAIRTNPEYDFMTQEQMINELIASHMIGDLTDEQYIGLGTLQDNAYKVQQRITDTESLINESTNEITRQQKDLEDLNTLVRVNREQLVKTEANYVLLSDKIKLPAAIKPEAQKTVITDPMPETTFHDAQKRQDEVYITKFAEEFAHPFSITEGKGNWFTTTGNQKTQVIETPHANDDLARSYNFNNKFAYLKKDGRSVYTFKSYTLKQIGELDPNNPLRKQLKFFDGESLKTYDQITDKSNIEANNDIKIVVHDRTGNLILSDKSGDPTVEKGEFVLSSSLPKAELKYGNTGYDRFSINTETGNYLKSKGIEKPSKLQTEEAETFVKDELEKARKEYEDFRTELKNKSATFDIQSINPGVKLTDGAEDLSPLEAIGSKDPANLIRGSRLKYVAVTPETPYEKVVIRNWSGAEHGLINGYWYWGTQNRLELIKPKTLGETKSIDKIMGLLQYFARDVKNAELKKFLHTILYTGVNDHLGKESKYKFKFEYPQDKNNKIIGDVKSLVFGDKEISIKDLVEGKNLEALREFLNTKYWNFDNNYANQRTFRELYIDSKDNKLKSRTWESQDGGYNGFLFNGVEGNEVKGTVYVRRPAEGLDNAIKPQYRNQSLQLNQIDENAKIIKPKNTQEGMLPKGSTSTFVPFSKLVSKPGETTTGAKPEIKTTSTFVPFGQTAKSGQDFTAFQKVPRPVEPVEEVKPAITKEPIQLLTPDEHWTNLQKSDPEYVTNLIESFDGDIDNAKSAAYITYKKAQDTISGLSRKYDTELVKSKQFKSEDLTATKSWLREKFPNIPVEVVDGLIAGEDWGKLTKGSKILLSSIAAEGTGYHEGFHTFSQLVLSTESRIKLYNEVRERVKNKELTDTQAEEILAEEFRMYMLTPKLYSFGKNETVKKTFFEKIFDFIRSIFRIEKQDATTGQIELVFDILNHGQFDVTPKELPTEWGRKVDRNRVEGLGDDETLLFIRDMNYRFFNTLFDPSGVFLDKVFFDANQSFKTIYLTLKNEYKQVADAGKEGSNYSKKIGEHFAELVKEHQRFLKQYNIKLPNQKDLLEQLLKGEDERENKDNHTYQDGTEINPTELARNQIRYLIAGLPSVVNDIKVTGSLSEYKTRSTVSFDKVMNTLNSNLADLGVDFKEYANKLRELSYKQPELKELIKRLDVDNKEPSASIVRLQNQFINAFAHFKNTPILFANQPDGTKSFFDAVNNTDNRYIRGIWLGNARLAGESDSTHSFIYRTKDERGTLVIDKPKLIKAITEANAIKDGSREQLNRRLTILRGLGITIASDINSVYDDGSIKNYLSRLSDDIKANKEELLAVDLFNPDLVRNQKETGALLNLTKKYMSNDTDLSFYNQDHNREYSINLPSHTTDVIGILNRTTYNLKTGKFSDIPGFEQLKPWDGTTGNLFNMHSHWHEHMKVGGKFRVIDLKGLADNINDNNSARISKTTFGDYKSITFNSWLHGYEVQLRSADRRLEKAFDLLDETGERIKQNYDVTRQMFKDDMYNYLRDELSTSFALLIDPDNWGGKLSHYSENAKKLRQFNFLYDTELNRGEKFNLVSLDQFVHELNPTDVRPTDQKALDLVERYISRYGEYLNRSFDRFIDKTIDLTRKSLLEDGLINQRFTSKGESMGIYIPGIDLDALKKMGITPYYLTGHITETQLSKILGFVTYKSFISAQEQYKFISGDPAMWKDITDAHARVNGATSTKEKLADSPELHQDMDRLWKRLDGRSRNSTLDILVFKDVIKDIKPLSDIYSDYKTTNTTDSQSWATLDEYRDMMLRTGSWDDSQEVTYQHETQQFIKRLLKLKDSGKTYPFLGKINKKMFTDKDGLFYEHTKGNFTEESMFKGKPIDETKLGVLQILKPQGFGPVANFNGLRAVQFLKTSTAPIFYSRLLDDSPAFEKILHMLDSKTGLLAAESSMKGVILDQAKEVFGKEVIPVEGFSTQQLYYRDFGFQLDISPEEKGNVSNSTQAARIDFSNLHNLGKLTASEYLGQLREEAMKITNEIVSLERGKFLDEFGLTSDKEGVFELRTPEDIQKFKDKIVESFDYSLLPYNILYGINETLASKHKVFDVITSKQKVEEILTSVLRHRVISRKLKGDMLVEESPTLYNPDMSTYSTPGKPMEIMITQPRDLQPLVDRVGGLDKLNTAIRKKDIKLLGEDFFKILDIPMNRIPGQSLNSLEVGHTVEFLPTYHGPKVLMADGATVKSSTDFDVDKMTSYFHNYTIDKEGYLHYHKDETTLTGKQNRYIDLITRARLDPERYNELIKPLDPKNLKKIAKEVEKRIIRTSVEQESFLTGKGQQNKWENLSSWWYNVQKANEFFRSKDGTAISSIQNASTRLSQVHPVRIANLVPLYFKGHSNTPFYTNGFLRDSEGYETAANIAEFQSGFVDSIKNPFIFGLTDANTFNTIAFLNRYGKEDLGGIGLKTVIAFTTQDAIREFQHVRRENTGKFLDESQYHGTLSPKDFKIRNNYQEQYAIAVKRIKNRLGGVSENIADTYDKTVASSLQKYLDIPVANTADKDIALRNLKLAVDKSGYREMSYEDLISDKVRNSIKDQVQILDTFLAYQLYGNELSQLNLQLRPDASSSLGRHISGIEANMLLPMDRIYSTGLFNTEDINNVIGTDEKPDLITEYYKTQRRIKDMLGWMSIMHKDPKLYEYLQGIIYPEVARKYRSRKDVDRILAHTESDFMAFVIADALGTKDFREQQNIYRELFTSENSVPKQLARIKTQVKDNIAINELEPLIGERNRKSRTISGTDNITLYNKNTDTHLLDAIESELYALGLNPNADVNKFVYHLMLHSTFQSGFQNAANSYMSVIPNRLFVDIAERAVNKFLDLSDEAKEIKMDSFWEQFHRMNGKDSDIVPRGRYLIRGGKKMNYWFPKEYVDKSGWFRDYNWISFNYNTHDPRAFKNKDLKVPRDIVLFARTGMDTFEPTSMQGDGPRLREYYPGLVSGDVDRVSILPANLYNNQPIDISYDKSIKLNNPTEDFKGIGDLLGEEEFTLPFDEPVSFDPTMIHKNYETVPEGESNSYKALGAKSTIQAGLSALERISTNPANIALAKVLRSALRIPRVLRIESEYFEKPDNISPETGRPDEIGYYTRISKTAGVYSKLADASFEEALLHEAVHDLSLTEYDKGGVFAQKLNRLVESTYEYLTDPRFSNNEYIQEILKSYNSLFHEKKSEFITHGLTDSTFQSLLAKLPSEDAKTTQDILSKRSKLQDFVTHIIDMLKEYFDKIFRPTNPEYASKLENMTSKLHDLIALTEENLLGESDVTPGGIIREIDTTIPTRDEFKVINRNELGKEKVSFEQPISKEEGGFSKLFPEYEHFNNVEIEAFDDAVKRGYIKIICGL